MSKISNESTILIVDDQPENIDVLSNILRADYKVKAAINGEKALEIIQQKQLPDLILLDIMMPGVDGYEVCRQLKSDSHTCDIPVIFVSALQNVDDRVTAFTAGGVDYITKPVQPEEVRARVQTHIQLKKMQQQLKQSNDDLEEKVKERTLELETAYTDLHDSHLKIVESENKYRSLLEAAPDAVLLVNEQGLIEMVNHEASRLFDYSAEELLGQSVEILVPDTANDHVSHRLNYMSEPKISGQKIGGINRNLKLHALRKDGHEIPVDISLSPVETNDGIKVIVDVRDNTEREQLNAQLQQAQKMESIGHLTGGIAHDFNNMLASILGFTQLSILMNEELQSEKLNEYLQEINKAGERARDLILQMLSFSRRNVDKEHLPVEPEHLIKEVVTMLRPMLPSSIKIICTLDSEAPKIKVDPVKLHQVLTNMCINARDALLGQGQIELKLRLRKFESEICASCHNPVSGEFVEIMIIDNGSGIDDENIKNIFDPFFTTKEVGKGTGMGLSVVHGIMHDHMGHVLIDSVLDKGTTFCLLFPPAKEVERINEKFDC